jgi:hypothetical protein
MDVGPMRARLRPATLSQEPCARFRVPIADAAELRRLQEPGRRFLARATGTRLTKLKKPRSHPGR